MSVRDNLRMEGQSVSILGTECQGSSASVREVLRLGSSFSSQGIFETRFHSLCHSLRQIAAGISVLSGVNVRSSLSLRTFARFASAVFVSGNDSLGSSV